MKLTYWKAERLDDADAYSIREKTRKAALAKLAEYEDTDYGVRFGPLVKVTLDYSDGFELMECLLGEGRGSELMLPGTEGTP